MGFFFLRRAPVAMKSGKVVLFGCNNAVGQPLSLLLKMNPHVEELVCCSTAVDGAVPAAGVAADLSHMDTLSKVRYARDEAEWPALLRDAQVVLVCSGSSFDPLREDRDIALRGSAPAVRRVMRAVATSDTKAQLAIVSSPVNALTPFCAELLKRSGTFDPRRLFGVTTLDVIRTRKLVAEALHMNPYDVNVPVVGGRGGVTACPLIAKTGLRLPPEEIIRITSEVQSYGVPVEAAVGADTHDAISTEVAPPVALGLAFAACDFAVSLLKALRGDVGIVECALVESTMRTEVPFFSSRVELGRDGVERIFPMGPLTSFENELIETAVPELVKDVKAGTEAASKE
ncbi:putative mitochondrial malate dehydrogenase [Leptomonas pyrrhocoris]|uniref:Malate dehydrogenase n=1 Tax=Leptomonas pyrrhocoris TaxID=157538 RepID=A0A0N0DWN7_LEPPY|nr:putative mitochondrial malate dehydrogenase [Leptomonas pyrrhocoris]XP_015660432.1 putative mitochondrial malate dehydrogenase [Leptomonas pyrrhocoris]KPA81992.1 putative mitochondrial malate dehydrogenase [Leptomonas pyrrhocoris]KPA81993.1 putative mitochondrial malate dehydrogenase [Leptomonas pyrrhocoris]|eukprot:XP_015660431.1 putative mitochondrial malate dehydrogenase [Leptomonas pyrrhocoris]